MRCKAQSAAMPVGIASICNAAARPYRVDSAEPIAVIQWPKLGSMFGRWRFAIAWLLLLALPLQGLAAATMLNCGAGHGAPALHNEAQSAAHHDAHQHQHHHTTGHGLNQLAKFKCSACAVCCIGAALPATLLVFAPAVPQALPGPVITVQPVEFVTDGPDRPPRFTPA